AGIDHSLRLKRGPGTTVYFELDLVGNVRRLRGPNGTDLGGYRYAAFGKTVTDDALVDQPLRWKARWYSPVAGGIYDVRARQLSPELGSFLSIDEYAFHDAASTLWGWPNQNPVSLSDFSGRSRQPPGMGDVGIFTPGQINWLFDGSGQEGYAASQALDGGRYLSAYAHFAESVALFDAAIGASLLARRHATGADLAMMACPIEIPVGGAAGVGEAGAADAAIAAYAAKHYPKLSP
ncbi:MAG TPA: hypothetical protein VLT33_00900, partial [Labilithrix sp.]|nr:hypothetical protein [Labilithrix sp.]